ncbi:MAG TPA: hypothetical protein VGP46_02135 [Acidimicrobiales bacterium]|jgi:hypothetical protein|nr:hypothetical protein [Acidimicrobiales bacterium]
MPDPSFYRPSHSEFGHIDADVQQRLVTVVAGDGARSRGVLYLPPGKQPSTVVVRTHPSGDLPQHWAAPYWVGGGYAFMSFSTRYVNNYTSCVHERIVLDVAGLMKFLKQEMGFEHVVFHGQSGGAACLSFYQAEATTPVGSRLTSPPAGGPPDLNEYELPPADALVLVAGHPGQGKFLQGVIDPSVVDESDALSLDPDLDMYDERNGWRLPPEPSKYSLAWLEQYRAGQAARVRRIDSMAREAIESRATAASLLGAAGFETLDDRRRRQLERRAHVERVMIVHRTEANPAYTDLTIDPSGRNYGSILGDRPDLQNYGSTGFGKIVSAEAWLSTWSGHSANASLELNLPKIAEPTLFVFPTADQDIYPPAFERQLEQSTAPDRQAFWLEGVDHYFRPGGVKPYPGDVRADAMDRIIAWTRDRFAA